MRIPLALALMCAAVCPAQDWRVLEKSESEGMLSRYLRGLARQLLDRRRAEVAAIASKEGYEARKARLREAALGMLGGLDDARTPLNPQVTGTLERDGYRVEKVIFESRPRFYVTANLYLPSGRGPFPCILHPVGHSTTAKNRAFYQRLSIGLVKQGFAVLIYDPIGQGERRIFWDQDLGDSKAGGTTAEHSLIGWQSLLGGQSVARYRVWDGMRGLDYLESRPEVDRTRLGVTGCSGGGTLTAYIAALDRRIKAAAPACYISSWEEQLEGTGPQDAEQQFPDQLVAGLNHADWIGLAAPIPYLIVSTDQDFFPLAGARRTFEEMKRIYGLYDASIKIDWFHEPGGHGWPKASREAIYGWMKRWLRGESGPVKEPDFPVEAEEDLNVTKTGQVATSLGGETASTLNIRQWKDRTPARPVPAETLRKAVLELTRYNRTAAPLAIRRMGDSKLAFTSGEGLTVPALLVHPPGGHRGKTVLYLDSRGKSAGMSEEGDIAKLAAQGFTVLAIDVSGTGETGYGRDARMPWLALMAGRPLIGIRMNDILRALDALAELKLLPAEGAGAYARGRIGTALLHAALLDSRIRSVIVEENLVSWQAVAAAPIHREIEDIALPGVLGRYDLPDLAAALAPRPVTLYNLTSPTGQVLPRRQAEAAYRGANVTVALRPEWQPLEIR